MVRDLHPDFYDYVMTQLAINNWPLQEVEWSTSYRKLQAKRAILKELAPEGYVFVIAWCETCSSYDKKCPYHIQLQSLEEYAESKGDIL